MPPKQSSDKQAKTLTQEFLVGQLQSLKTDILQKVDTKIEESKKFLRSEIEYSRKDARNQLHAVVEGLNKKIDSVDEGLNKKIDSVYSELKATQVAVKEVKNDTVELTKRLDGVEKKIDLVVEKVERHDKDIGMLKRAAALE